MEGARREGAGWTGNPAGRHAGRRRPRQTPGYVASALVAVCVAIGVMPASAQVVDEFNNALNVSLGLFNDSNELLGTTQVLFF